VSKKNGTSMNEQDRKPDSSSLLSYLIAAAVLIPVGWWLKANFLSEQELGYYILSLGGLLY
jgi:hypothetical protein